MYHKLLRVYSFPKHHKKLTFTTIFLLLVLSWLSPFYKHTPLIKSLAQGFFSGTPDDLKSTNGRTNFIILGLGGSKSEPSSLTDTQQFFSYDHNKKRHILLSIPRDIWLPDLGIKINSAYAYGNKIEGTGIDLTKKSITDITGEPVHYSVMISFDGFTKLIDVLGGINVYVDQSFTDPQYPIKGRENDTCNGDPEYRCRWESITFERGLHHFDGSTALKFVRSRHARGDEGTDYARAARQQKVMLSIKKKVFSPKIFLNPAKIEIILSSLSEVIETDLPQKDWGIVGRAFLETRGKNIHTESLPAIDPTNKDENLDKSALLIHPPISPLYLNQWVLIPIGGNWTPTQKWVACLLEKDDCPVADFAPAWKKR